MVVSEIRQQERAVHTEARLDTKTTGILSWRVQMPLLRRLIVESIMNASKRDERGAAYLSI